MTVAEELVILNIFVQLSHFLPQKRGQRQVLILSQQIVAGADLQQFGEDGKGQLQVPAFALNTKGAWILRFDDILADALELGPLQNHDISLPQEALDLLAERTPKGVPDTLLSMLAKYYLAHLQEGEEWVVLPVSAVDAYYSNNNFSKKWKQILPKDLIEFKNSYGICKYKLKN